MAAGISRVNGLMRAENMLLAAQVAHLFGTQELRFGALQMDLWHAVSFAEHRLSTLRRRRTPRNRTWKRRRCGRELRPAHLRALEYQERLLKERISIAKQIGDALAWSLARNDPRYIKLHHRRRSHTLPSGSAVDSYFHILEAAEKSSEYAAVLTDLTRCWGVGDVLILGSRWPVPSSFEAKARRESNGSLSVFLHGHSAAFQVYPDEMERFARVFGAKVPSATFDDRGTRQTKEVDAETKRSFDALTSTFRYATPVLRGNWRSVQGVLSRALSGQKACDLAEPGVAYVAAPLISLDPSTPRESIWELVRRAEIDANPNEWGMWSSVELAYRDELSAVVTPVLAWNLPAAHRAALLFGDIVFVTVARLTVWREAFRRAGVTVDRTEEDGWMLTGFGQEMVFDAFDVERLVAGMMYSATSPQRAAEFVAIQLRHPDQIVVQRYRRSADEPLESLVHRDPATGKWRPIE
ncbi:MAG TPA: hypothetical protein VF092_29615 [Longimicrobium sp.]